ncbi:MAG: hypothetical protein IT384_27425 [Deltaproteobacteria bacterium]|nr:hypothetical protein [Deltaproteobacteria bacterium]
MEARLAEVPDEHRRGIERFRGRIDELQKGGFLNAGQASVLVEHLLRLAERNFNPANTGNLEDLFCYTVIDTRDPVRAFAQVLADSVKIVPMDENAPLWPPVRELKTGRLCRRVGDLSGYDAGDKMLISHTMVAYGDAELRSLAAAFVRATHPRLDSTTVTQHVARMAAQSQHGPSSTFVLARMHGLTIDIGEVYRAAGYQDEEIEAAQRFYDICGRFEPDWVNTFLDGNTPDTPEWEHWRTQYLALRQQLRAELVYQLSSDTLTNFLEGTLESGKWTDASIIFGGVTEAEEIPRALAQIVNQYIAEHVALHDRPAQELMRAVEIPLQPWGVGFSSGRAIPLPEGPKKIEEIRAQFEVAWARRGKASH